MRCVDRSRSLVGSARSVPTAPLYNSVHGTSAYKERDVVLGTSVSRPSLFLVGGFISTDEGLVEFLLLEQRWFVASAWCGGGGELLVEDGGGCYQGLVEETA